MKQLNKIILIFTSLLNFVYLASATSNNLAVDNSYGKRIQDAIVGFVFGFILAILGIIVLWVVEKQGIKFHTILGRCRKVIIYS